MMGNPVISAVITTYNRRDLVPQAIESALSQDSDDMEVLVVDDGSADGTAATLTSRYAADPRVQVIERENGGPPAARNTGIALARGKYVALLDSDDVWLPGYLASQLEVLNSTGADLVVSNGEFDDAKLGHVLLFDHPEWVFPDSIAAMCAGAWMLPSFSVMRTEVARRIGFDESFRICDDTEFLFRFHKKGYHCAFNPKIAARYRSMDAGAPQLSGDHDRLELNCYRVWKHHSREHPEALLRGPNFDRMYGELLLNDGQVADAYPLLRRLWRAQPLSPSAALLYARASIARLRRAV